MANRLARENSPYLLQHAENPVDWYPWGPEAMAEARRQDKPIFLSVGYAACHWCHVMAHESFEDLPTARLMNENFINVKVDREERPDVDQIYMGAVQMLTGRGGWPMSVFLTPDGEPFYGGTYWPRVAAGNMPGFGQILRAVAEAWRDRRASAVEQASKITRVLREERLEDSPSKAEPSPRPLEEAESWLRRSFDRQWGGFGEAPKFPQAINLRLLLRRWRRNRDPAILDIVRTTLDRMAAGGMYDHLGGGFHRYSVDARWLVPHFEKMLYDQAMLAEAYLEAWQVTGDDEYARVVGETIDYVLRDLTDAQGGFYASEDADSDGEEGLFYLWTPDEICEVLGAGPARTFSAFYGVTEAGNFEGRNILHRPASLEETPPRAALDDARRRLLAARSGRRRPGRDDKVLVAGNALMIGAMARAGAALGRPEYVEAAARAADFLLTQVRADGRLLHYWRQGLASGEAYLDDCAALAGALVSLYQAQFDERWIDQALLLADRMLHRFSDRDHGGFFYSGTPEELIVRQKDVFDSSVPSSTGLATMALVQLGRLCNRRDYLEAARGALEAHATLLERAPAACGQMLMALDAWFAPPVEVVILGSDDAPATAEVVGNLHRCYVPDLVIACRTPQERPNGALRDLFAQKRPIAPGPTVYICRDFTCQEPITGKDEALAAWSQLAARSP